MICSECSQPIKPVVAIDIDGTLADYHGHFIAFLEDYLGFKVMRQYGGDVSFKEWVKSYYEIDDRTWHDIKLAYRQGAQKRSATIYPHAMRLCQDIRQYGAEIWLTTTRPYLRLDNIDPDTRAWLERHQIVFDHLLYDEDKYGQLASRVDRQRIVAVVDDLPEQYDRAVEIWGPRVPILVNTMYNRNVERLNQFHGLDYVDLEITDRLKRWREQHEESTGVGSVEGRAEHRQGDLR